MSIEQSVKLLGSDLDPSTDGGQTSALLFTRSLVVCKAPLSVCLPLGAFPESIGRGLSKGLAAVQSIYPKLRIW